jgi:hypothetical protein
VASRIHWQFVAHDNGLKESWVWRCIAIDGGIERMSEAHPDFGKAVLDATQHGFSPRTQAYVVIAKGWVTHYHPYGAAASIPPDSVPAVPVHKGPARKDIRTAVGEVRKPARRKKDTPQGHR